MWRRVLRLSTFEIVKFQERVGYRYCAHKQQRLAAAAAYYRAEEYSRNQAIAFVDRLEQLTVRASMSIQKVRWGAELWRFFFFWFF